MGAKAAQLDVGDRSAGKRGHDRSQLQPLHHLLPQQRPVKSMRPGMAQPLSRVRYIIWFVLLCTLAVAAQKPEVQVTHFKNHPARIFYFDDTTVSDSLRLGSIQHIVVVKLRVLQWLPLEYVVLLVFALVMSRRVITSANPLAPGCALPRCPSSYTIPL